VIVNDERRTEVAVVTTGMSEVERARTDKYRERDGE
jgi:hypothetical protein